MDYLLTAIESAGTVTEVPKSYDFNLLATHLIALRKQGHAVHVDEVYEHGEAFGKLRVFHALTCAVCQKGER